VYDLIPLIEENPSLLGIGLDEQTAIIVHADRFEVIGKSVVAITDARRLDMRTQSISKNAASKSIYFVGNAQWFDLVKRSILN
jgi:cyanophycinase